MNKYTADLSLFSGFFSVDLRLWNQLKNGYSSISVVIDTGAATTTISDDILFRAGYDVAGGKTKRIITASSVEYVHEITIPRIMLGDLQLSDVNVYAHTFPQESLLTGVIGLDILRDFDIHIEQSTHTLELIEQ
jgi:predicted aspartyl protease